MKFCPQCGTEINEGAKFCTACGYQVSSEQQSAPPPQGEPSQQAEEPIKEQAKEVVNVFTDAVTGKTNLLQRVINILTKPKQEWEVIRQEKPHMVNLIFGYVLVLALIPAIAIFLRYGLIGTSLLGATHRSIGGGILHALIQLIGSGIGIYLFAWVIDWLAPNFESEKDMGRSLQLAAYSITPVWVLGILYLFSFMASLVIFLGAVYSIYLIYLGIPVIKKTPADKTTGYLVISMIAYLAIHLIVMKLLDLVLL